MPLISFDSLASTLSSIAISFNRTSYTRDMSVIVESFGDVQDFILPMNQSAVGTSSMNGDALLQYLKGTVGFACFCNVCSWRLSFRLSLLQNIPILCLIWTIMVSFRFVSCFPFSINRCQQ